MSAFSFLFGTPSVSECEIPEIYSLTLDEDGFVQSDILSTYLKILTDTVERVHGLPDSYDRFLWDNCVQNEANEGLISLLANAMVKKEDLFLVFKADVLRRADDKEQEQIKKDYKERNESKVGAYISFKHYRRTELLEIYAGFEYCVIASLNKNLNLSKAVQLKINELRASVSLNDSEVAKTQAKQVASALGKGNDVMLDAKDVIETAKIDIEPTDKAISFLDAKKAFILGLPLSYISGEQTPGIGSTGEADMRAVERGLKQYFVSILYPVLNAVFGKETTFKSQDVRQMTSCLEVLKTFELVSDELLSREAKQEILNRIFELDEKVEERAKEREAKERENNEEESESEEEPEEKGNRKEKVGGQEKAR